MVYDIDEPEFCSESDPKILFIVMSKSNETEKRKVIRETWFLIFYPTSFYTFQCLGLNQSGHIILEFGESFSERTLHIC